MLMYLELDDGQETNQSRSERDCVLSVCQPPGASGKDQDYRPRVGDKQRVFPLYCSARINVTRYINNPASPGKTSDQGEHKMPRRYQGPDGKSCEEQTR